MTAGGRVRTMDRMEHPGDTVLDAIAAQARAHPPLPLDTVQRLLVAARDQPRGSAEETLIRHHLGIALDASLARRSSGLEIGDLYQEASVAVVTAVEEYAARAGAAAGLQGYVRRVIDLHLDAAVEREEEQRRSDAAVVEDTRLLEVAEVALRHQLGRTATSLELAAALQWPAERVDLLSAMLADARAINDATLIPFLDDVDVDDGDAG